MSYQTSSKRQPPFCLLISARKFLCTSFIFLNSVQKRVQTLYIREYKSPPPPQLGRGTIAPCKVIQDSLGFWIPCCGLWTPGTGFWIPCQWNVDCGLWIVDSNRQKEFFELNTGFQSPGFRIPEFASKKLPGFRESRYYLSWGKMRSFNF